MTKTQKNRPTYICHGMHRCAKITDDICLWRSQEKQAYCDLWRAEAKELYDEYSFFDKEVVYYPSKDVLFYQSDIRGNLLTAERIRALKAIREQERVTIVTTFDALMNTMAPVEKMGKRAYT